MAESRSWQVVRSRVKSEVRYEGDEVVGIDCKPVMEGNQIITFHSSEQEVREYIEKDFQAHSGELGSDEGFEYAYVHWGHRRLLKSGIAQRRFK